MADENLDCDYHGRPCRIPRLTLDQIMAELPLRRRGSVVMDLPDGGWAIQARDGWYRLNEDGSINFDEPVEVGDPMDPARLNRKLPPFPDSWKRG